MQKLAEICIRRPVFASMLILSLVVVGAASYTHLDVDRFPSVDFPVVRINARLPGLRRRRWNRRSRNPSRRR
jgi:HAE1 family hydrophobic/amphiphilic exporter-1